MAEGYSDTAVFDCQVKACKTFFEDQLPTVKFYPLDIIPDNLKRFKERPIYDITGLDGHQVVFVLFSIVNDKDQFKKNKTFYLLIQGNPQDDLEEVFRLQARPTKHQPGNGIVFLRPRGKELFKRGSAKSYEELNGALKANYDIKDDKGRLILSDTTSFAKHIKNLFKNNARNKAIPQATFENMILLFEIARRLVKSENPSDKKEAFDVLPIGSAIAGILKSLELGKCRFEDVFFPPSKKVKDTSKFHCFSKEPEVRRKAIEQINLATMDITKATTKDHLGELQELFCSEERLAEITSKKEEELATEFKNLMTRISSPKRSWSVTERRTAFDHCTR